MRKCKGDKKLKTRFILLRSVKTKKTKDKIKLVMCYVSESKKLGLK